MTHSFSELANGAKSLRVELKKGDIHVRAGEGLDWKLEWSSDGKEGPELEREGDLLRVRHRANGFLPGGLDAKRMDIRLLMPLGVQVVELRTGLGRVEAEGLDGRLNLTTGNGAMSLRSSRGEAGLNTGNGEVSINDFTGEVTASTGNGRVNVNLLRGKLALNTGNGQIEVLDVDGRVRASTGNGDLRLVSVAGEVELNTGHGQVEIGAPRSLLVQASSAMGSVHIEGGSLRGLRVNSTMGEVECASTLEAGKYELSSGMGAIILHLATRETARVDAQTGFGQVDSDFPLVRVGRSGPMGFGGVRMVGSIGEGDPQVNVSLRSGKGPIRLLRAEPSSSPQPAGERFSAHTAPHGHWTPPARPHHGPSPTPQPHPHMDHTGADPTLAVLEAVARGELSPEDADQLLRRADAV